MKKVLRTLGVLLLIVVMGTTGVLAAEETDVSVSAAAQSEDEESVTAVQSEDEEEGVAVQSEDEEEGVAAQSEDEEEGVAAQSEDEEAGIAAQSEDEEAGIEAQSEDTSNLTGWVEKNGKKYYYENGTPVTGTPIIDGKKYWLVNGEMKTGWLYLTGWKMYFDPETGAAKTGMCEIGGHTYLFNSDGVMQSYAGTPVIDGKKYWFSTEGYLKSGWLYLGNWKMYFDPETYAAKTGLCKINGHAYLFNSDGVMQAYAGTPVIDGKKYWFSTEGYLKSGWLYLGNWKMYFDPETYTAKTGLCKIDGHAYLFNSDGVMQAYAGTPVIDGKKYWFSTEGYLKGGWLYLGNWKMYFDPETYVAKTGLCKINGHAYLFSSDGVMQGTPGTPVIDGKKYWFSTEGYLKSGWLTLGSYTLYFDPTTYQAATGPKKIDGKMYLFDSNGVLQTGSGTPIVDGYKYWLSNGILQSGWLSMPGWKMYFDPTTYRAATGFKTISGSTYYFNENGTMATGLTTVGSYMYYFNSDGTMVKNTSVTINGVTYKFDSEGKCPVDLTAIYPGPYLLKVDRTNCVITVYAKDSNGNYTLPVKAMTCSVGLSGTPTPTGTYTTDAKYKLKELMGPSWGKWATHIVGGIYFHSVATSSASDPTHTVPAAEYNKLGQPASHGCVRLNVRDAKWIYDNCALGTTVVIGDNFDMPLGKPDTIKITGSVDPTDPEA